MIVTCSNCAARYAVDPLAIGPGGRTVECARCHYRWFQRVEGPPPAPDLVIRPPTRGVTAQLPAVIAPKPDFAWGGVVAVAVAVVVLLAAAAFAFRQEIMAMMSNEASVERPASVAAAPPAQPRAAPAKITMPDPPARPQLEIDVAASKIELIDGHYVVQGEIVNTGQAIGSTSTLKLTFKKDNDVLGERSYALIEGPIAPGARVGFRQTLDDPPDGTTDIVPAVE
jgi:predicted Zn finger-like uncharacterized protein